MSDFGKKTKKVFNKQQYIRKFIRELKSGKYEQTTQQLKNGEGAYCLWGLGCELYRQDYNSCDWEGNELSYIPDDWQEQLWGDTSLSIDKIKEYTDSELPVFLAEKLGTNTDGCIQLAPGKIVSTMVLNDGGVTFEGLAALLEVYPFTTKDRTFNTLVGDVRKNLAYLFKKTKLAKTWRTKAIESNSDFDEALLELEEKEEDSNG